MNQKGGILAFCLLITIGLTSGKQARYEENDDETTLESPRVTNWGEWGNLEKCHPGFLVTGFQLEVETKQKDNDNTALNGVRFSCGMPNRTDNREVEVITSSAGRYGTLRDKMFCNRFATGFQMKSQKFQHGYADNVAAVNLKLICDDGEIFEGYNEEKDNYYPDSEYTEQVVCPAQFAICGLQTQIEPPQLHRDDTSLNNMRIRCCKVPDIYLGKPAPTPEPVVVTPEEPTNSEVEEQSF